MKVGVPQPYEVTRHVPYAVKEYVKVPVHVPQPYVVEKKIPYPVHVPVDRPVPVKVKQLDQLIVFRHQPDAYYPIYPMFRRISL